MANLIANTTYLKKIDQFFLYAVVPLLGITIPNITGIIVNSNFVWWQLILSYGFFILTSFLVWKGNMLLVKNIRKQSEKNTPEYYRIILWYFSSTLIYTGVVSGAMLTGWYFIFNGRAFNWVAISQTTALIVFCVILINTIYEIIFLRQEMEDSFLKMQLLEMDKIKAELTSLKSQIDPHFIFNSLNTLSYLITGKPAIAKIFNETLAKVYRYILVYKDENLVFLKEELEFVTNYFYLISIRYEQAVNLIIEIPDTKAENYLITPVSLQVLIENAIKHNEFSKKEPLTVFLSVQSGFVTVNNRIRKKEYAEASSGIGLNNLKERSFLVTNRNIIITNEHNEFTVRVPILKS